MNVFHFGTGERRLFGIYSPGRSTRAALLCAPWGQEYLRAHRSLRQLGDQLRGAGFHAMRFDYFGTGDSAGEMTDATLAGWEDDVEQALDELRDSSGAERVSLVGLRLGATLAARVAARRRRDVRDLVLWDPVISGSAYLEELRAPGSNMYPPRQRDASPGGGVEINGFPLTDDFARELATVNLVPLAATLPARTLVVTSDASAAAQPQARTFRETLTSRTDGPVVDAVEAPPVWLEHGNVEGALPVAVLHRITEWLA